MKNKRLPKLTIIALAALLLSCSQESTGPATNAGKVSFKPLTFAQWSEQLGNYRNKVVVVDLWATWCLPCIERFPKMVDLNNKYADDRVAFVSINFDDAEDTESLQKAEGFLQDVGAEFDNFYFNENLIDAFEHMAIIALPTVVIFNQGGAESRRLTNTNPNKQFTAQDIETEIERLLASN